MQTILRLHAHKHPWIKLQGKKILNKNILIKDYGDVHPFPGIMFPLAENIFMDGCYKNFVYYWANKFTFPNAKKLYLRSHPCECDVLRRDFETINMTEDFSRYADRWGLANLYLMTDEEYSNLINSYNDESMHWTYFDNYGSKKYADSCGIYL